MMRYFNKIPFMKHWKIAILPIFDIKIATLCVWFIIISFPILLSGIFIFIPTTILCYFIVAFFVSLIEDYLQLLAEDTFICILLTFGVMWFLIVIIICTMEFFNGTNWFKSYRIGFLGEYCNESDYFEFNKWNEYPLDIKFLIISWFIF